MQDYLSFVSSSDLWGRRVWQLEEPLCKTWYEDYLPPDFLYLLTTALVFFLEVTLRVNLLGRSSIQWFVVQASSQPLI